MKPVKLGLLGVGTVGASTAMVLKNNAAEIARRAGRSIEIIQASRRSIGSGMPEGCDNIELVADPFEVVNNPEVDIVIELDRWLSACARAGDAGDCEWQACGHRQQGIDCTAR